MEILISSTYIRVAKASICSTLLEDTHTTFKSNKTITNSMLNNDNEGTKNPKPTIYPIITFG